MPGDAITKQDLFDRLAEGHAAGITVVTPNRRLAQILRAEFDSFQKSKALAVWEEADILPLEAFVQRGYEDALYGDGGHALPLLLSDAQARELWVEAIEGSGWKDELRDVPGTAERALEAWRLAQAWRIAGGLEKFAATEDTRAFAEWAGTYARRLKKDGLIDLPLLFDLPLEFRKPKLLVAYAFDTAQTGDFLRRFEAASCSPEGKESTSKRTSFPSPRDELEAAARWARARLERGDRRIGVVVPELEQRRREVARVFARTMGSTAGSPLPFNLSVGQPLADYPIVAFALALLEFSLREIPYETASRLIRSPFLGGAEREMALRARLDATLRRKADGVISLPKLIAVLPPESGLRALLEKAFEARKQSASPHEWARQFSAILEAVRYPGVPGAREVQRDAGGVFAPLARTFENHRRKSVRQLAPPVRRNPVPAGEPGGRDGGAGAGAGAPGIRRHRLRRALGERPHRERLAAARAPGAFPVRRAAKEGGHSRVGRGDFARARPAHHRGLGACRRGSGLLLAAPRGGPRSAVQPSP